MDAGGIDGYEISTDPARLDLALVHRFLSEESYWSRGVSPEAVERSLAHSLVFGLYQAGQQVGFARVVTDRTFFAHLADVFVLPAHRGKGLARWLVTRVLAHEDLQGVRRIQLATSDAHDLYRRLGFRELERPGLFMERAGVDAPSHGRR